MSIYKYIKKFEKVKKRVKKEIILIIGTSGVAETSRIIKDTLDSIDANVSSNLAYDNKLKGIYKCCKKNTDYLIIDVNFVEAAEIVSFFRPAYILITDFNRDVLSENNLYFKSLTSLREILRNIRRGNCLIVNGDRRFLYRMIETRARVIYYGFNNNLSYLDYEGEDLRLEEDIKFNLDTKGELLPIKLNATGKNSAYNYLAAISLISELGYGLEDVEAIQRDSENKMDVDDLDFDSFYVKGHISLIEIKDYNSFLQHFEMAMDNEDNIAIVFDLAAGYINDFEELIDYDYSALKKETIDRVILIANDEELIKNFQTYDFAENKLLVSEDRETINENVISSEISNGDIYIYTDANGYDYYKNLLQQMERKLENEAEDNQ